MSHTIRNEGAGSPGGRVGEFEGGAVVVCEVAVSNGVTE